MKASQEYIDSRIAETASRLSYCFDPCDSLKAKNYVGRLFFGVVNICSSIAPPEYPNHIDVNRIAKNILIVTAKPKYREKIMAEISSAYQS